MRLRHRGDASRLRERLDQAPAGSVGDERDRVRGVTARRRPGVASSHGGRVPRRAPQAARLRRLPWRPGRRAGGAPPASGRGAAAPRLRRLAAPGLAASEQASSGATWALAWMAKPPTRESMSAEIRSLAACCAAPPGEHPAQRVEAVPGARGDGQHQGVVQALGVQQAAQVLLAVLDLVRREQVDLVEHHGDHAGVPGERDEVAAVHGGVRVLLRVEDEDQHVGELAQPVHRRHRRRDHRVVVGKVEQQQAVQGGLAGVQGAGPRVAVAALHAQPVEQRAGALHPPHAGVHVPGGRPGHARRRERGPGQRVEQRGLAAAGAAGQRDDGVVAGQPQALAGPSQQGLGVV